LNRRFVIHRAVVPILAAVALLAAGETLWAAPASAANYKPGVVVVGYRARRVAAAADVASAGKPASSPPASAQLVHLRPGVSVSSAVHRLRRQPGVAYAVPDYLAHITGVPPPGWLPNDPGTTHAAQGWQRTQWNFLPATGVNAPAAWANLFAEHRPGGRGIVIAILDTGVAYRNWDQFRKSPDFTGTRFAGGHDFVANNGYPLDREGHGTFVAGTIAESTNNGFGLTGLAYEATIMPVRVLDQNGLGDAATIAKGIRYAATHGARVINLSLEFPPSVSAGDIPDIMAAISFAHNRGAVVVAASGNEDSQQIAYPARAHMVISVGATTLDGCRADYSNGGPGLDLVAPGGGLDASLPNDPNCHPERGNLPDISQMTFADPSNPRRFSYPGGWYGTSMAAPHVAAIAGLVIASGVIGRHPTPDQVLARLELTARPLGGSKPNNDYGYGLVDAGAATAPAPAAVPARSSHARVN
jgi:serine protease